MIAVTPRCSGENRTPGKHWGELQSIPGPRRVEAGRATPLFVANKVLLMLVVVVMGKAGFQELKQCLSGYLGRLLSTDTVTPLRHAIGLVMFCVPLIASLLVPYIDAAFPGLRPNRWEARLVADLMFVASFFVLGGGNFWDKFRALLVRTARVIDARGV